MKIFRECLLTEHAVVEKDSYPVPPIFKLLAETGDITEQMMYNTYNMGLGMIVAVDPADVEKTMKAIEEAGDKTICCRPY